MPRPHIGTARQIELRLPDEFWKRLDSSPDKIAQRVREGLYHFWECEDDPVIRSHLVEVPPVEPVPAALIRDRLHHAAREYYLALAEELARLSFTPNEAAFLMDALNGKLFVPDFEPIQWLAMIVEDFLEAWPEREVTWKVDGTALLARLRDFTRLQALSVIDSAQRFFNGPVNEDETIQARLMRVGLLPNE